jgi:hypothetical protein
VRRWYGITAEQTESPAEREEIPIVETVRFFIQVNAGGNDVDDEFFRVLQEASKNVIVEVSEIERVGQEEELIRRETASLPEPCECVCAHGLAD